jgi:hypothetical protein
MDFVAMRNAYDVQALGFRPFGHHAASVTTVALHVSVAP